MQRELFSDEEETIIKALEWFITHLERVIKATEILMENPLFKTEANEAFIAERKQEKRKAELLLKDLQDDCNNC